MVVHDSPDDPCLDPGWCPECGEPRAVCEGHGTCPLSHTQINAEWNAAAEERWNNLIYEFGQFINRLQHKGSLGIMKFCDSVLPLRERLESGERTEQLYEQLMFTMQDLDPQ